MKNKIIALVFISSPLTGFAATDPCNDQLSDILNKTEMAKKQGNSAEIARLNIAYGKVETYCTDERQATRASHDVSRREMKVKKGELELQEDRKKLAEAKTDGRTDRIRMKISKVVEKKMKRESAKLDLKEARDDTQKVK